VAGIRIDLSPSEALSGFRDLAKNILDVADEITPKLYATLEKKARDMGVHPADFEIIAAELQISNKFAKTQKQSDQSSNCHDHMKRKDDNLKDVDEAEAAKKKSRKGKLISQKEAALIRERKLYDNMNMQRAKESAVHSSPKVIIAAELQAHKTCAQSQEPPATPIKQQDKKEIIYVLRSICEKYNDISFSHFEDTIPEKKIKTAKKYFSIPSDQKIIFLFDQTISFLGNCKKGFAICTGGIYMQKDEDLNYFDQYLAWGSYCEADIRKNEYWINIARSDKDRQADIGISHQASTISIRLAGIKKQDREKIYVMLTEIQSALKQYFSGVEN